MKQMLRPMLLAVAVVQLVLAPTRVTGSSVATVGTSPNHAAAFAFLAQFYGTAPNDCMPLTPSDVCQTTGITCAPETGHVTVLDWVYCTPQQGIFAVDFSIMPGSVRVFQTGPIPVDPYNPNDPNYQPTAFFNATGAIRFSSGSKLEKFVVAGAQFTSIDLTALPASLVWLDVSKNNKIAAPATLTSIPQTMLCLHLDGNQFTGLADMSMLPDTIRTFTIGSNRITSVKFGANLPKAFRGTLSFANNSIAQVTGPAGCINAATVDFSMNNLETVDWQLFTSAVQVLALWRNAMQTVDLSVLPTGLQQLTLYSNRLTSVTFAGANPALQVLDLCNNSIAVIAWRALPVGLTTFNIMQNRIAAVDLTALPVNLTVMGSLGTTAQDYQQGFYFTGNAISAVLTASSPPLAGVQTIDLSNQQLAAFDLTTFPSGVTTLYLSNNFIATVNFPPAQQLALGYLDLSFNKIIALSWDSLPAQLTTLYLSNNFIATVNFPPAQQLALGTLDLSFNKISALSWDSLPAQLTTFNVNSNHLTSADLTKLPAQLTQFGGGYNALSLAGNAIATVLVGQLPAQITTLDLSNQRIAQITLSGGNTQLTVLDLSNNFLTSSALHQLQLPKSLASLDLSGNNLTALNFDRLPKTLTSIFANHNDISVLQGQPAICNQLSLRHNMLTQFDLSTVPAAMTFLDLSFNNIANLVGSASAVPLPTLLLSGNRLTRFPVESVSAADLAYLAVDHNLIAEPLLSWVPSLTALASLDVGYNLLPCASQSFAGIPASLGNLAISGNNCGGVLDLTTIDTLSNLFANNCNLNGIATSATVQLNQLTASFNQISGTLPAALVANCQYLDLSHNELSGPLGVIRGAMFLADNRFTSEVVVGDNFRGQLDLSGNLGISGTPLLEVPTFVSLLNLDNTNICGEFNFTSYNLGSMTVTMPSRCTVVSSVDYDGDYYEGTMVTVTCPSC